MSDFYTRVGEGKYEVHFTTDEQWKYALVEAACREAIDHVKPLMVTENAPRWVRCEERLPDDNEIVLVCNDAGFVHCAFYTAIGRKWYIANNTQYDSWTWEPDAMYWMPLPEPPREGE